MINIVFSASCSASLLAISGQCSEPAAPSTPKAFGVMHKVTLSLSGGVWEERWELQNQQCRAALAHAQLQSELCEGREPPCIVCAGMDEGIA